MSTKFDDHAVKVEADHDAEVAAAIAEIVAALPADDEEIPADVGAVPAPVASAAEVAPSASSPGKVPEPVVTPPQSEAAQPDDRGMLRLLEREGQVRDRESALERRERDYADKLTQVERLIAERQSLAQKFYEDPEEAMKVLGVDPASVSQRLVARAMGDKAPPELRRQLELDPLRRELSELKAERERERREAAYAAERGRVQSNAREFSRGEGTGKYPALAAVAKVDADFVSQEIFNEIARDASERATREPNGQPISAEDAAERLNKRWETFSKAFTPAAPPQAAVAPAPLSTNATPPAKNAPAPAQPNPGAKAPTSSPPPRRPYWDMDRDVERDAALAEAVKIAKGLIPAPTA